MGLRKLFELAALVDRVGAPDSSRQPSRYDGGKRGAGLCCSQPATLFQSHALNSGVPQAVVDYWLGGIRRKE